MNIGIFGGSFDPIHLEHIHLAQAAIKGLGLDKLIIMPAGIPPHKQGKKLASAEHRLAMCRLAFQHLPQVEVSDHEIKQEGTSYTYLTCNYFAQEYPKAKLYWLVGTDMYRDFYHWKNPDQILQKATLAVCCRDEKAENLEAYQLEFEHTFGHTFAVIPYQGKNVSSTELRLRASIGMDIEEMTMPAVAEYIRVSHLYENELALSGLALEKKSRAEHSKRVCLLAMACADRYKLDKNKVFTASILHDVAKNLSIEDPRLQGFVSPEGVPDPVLHQFSGAYVLEHTFGITDEDILNAVKYHTSGRENMSDLEKLIFLADMLEMGRDFPGVENLRKALNVDLDYAMYCCLEHQVKYLQSQGGEIYPLTLQAYEYYKKSQEEDSNNGIDI